jgi:signal transduction histidine kinase
MRRDRDGALWIGTGDRGVVHVHEGRVDSFSLANGLSSPSVTAMFEDREGNMWVATQNGLDRFSESSVSLVSMEQGVAGSAYSVLADGPDTVWIGTSRGLHRWRRGPVTAVETDPRRKNSVFGGLLRDRGGRIWGSTLEGIGYLEGGRFTTLRSPRGIIRDFVQQRSGTIWAAAQIAGLLQLDPKGVVRQIAWSTFDRKDFATVLAADPAGEGLWLGFYEGGIAFFDGDVRRAYGDKDGLIGGRVNDLRFDQDGALWISTQSGLSRLEGGRFSTVPRLGGLSCAAVHWTIRDDAGALWLYTPCGLARVLRDDVPAWTAASSSGQGAAHVTPVTILNNSDGVMSELLPSGLRPLVAKGGDGRLWFSAANGVQVVDPKHLAFNRVAPPVYVERVVANHVGYEIANMPTTNLRLTAQVRDLVIDYTALSLVAPEKMRFRYKLEGWDNDWQDVGTRRQAFYTNLPPRRYRFRVMASNNSGVWNETGAAVDFAIEPAYYQTAWFLLLVVGLVLAAISGAHRIRLRFVETHEREITALNERLMKAQEQERMRIAGELHDGVAQEMLAATMLLGTARRRIPDDSPAKVTIDKVQEKLIKMGTDIRQISHHLHPPVLQEAGLPEAVRNYCEQFSASSAIAVPCETDEAARDLSPGAALALYRIMQEAIGNAAKHARATRIGVRVTRANGTVSLIVEDDGVGFARDALGSSQGLGLVTMRERAGQLGGTFQIESAPGRGTTIRVDIPFR